MIGPSAIMATSDRVPLAQVDLWEVETSTRPCDYCGLQGRCKWAFMDCYGRSVDLGHWPLYVKPPEYEEEP